jgi:hypothetical protein
MVPAKSGMCLRQFSFRQQRSTKLFSLEATQILFGEQDHVVLQVMPFTR